MANAEPPWFVYCFVHILNDHLYIYMLVNSSDTQSGKTYSIVHVQDCVSWSVCKERLLITLEGEINTKKVHPRKL